MEETHLERESGCQQWLAGWGKNEGVLGASNNCVFEISQVDWYEEDEAENERIEDW